MDTRKNFAVEARCGHVGHGVCVIATFFVHAESGKEAAAIVRMMPRVKHNHKNAIVSVIELSKEDWEAGRAEWNKFPYWYCKSKWQQELIMDSIRDYIVPDPNGPSYPKRPRHSTNRGGYKRGGKNSGRDDGFDDGEDEAS